MKLTTQPYHIIPMVVFDFVARQPSSATSARVVSRLMARKRPKVRQRVTQTRSMSSLHSMLEVSAGRLHRLLLATST